MAINCAPWRAHNNSDDTLAIWISCSCCPLLNYCGWVYVNDSLWRFYWNPTEPLWLPNKTTSHWHVGLVTLSSRPGDITLQQVSLHSQLIHTNTQDAFNCGSDQTGDMLLLSLQSVSMWASSILCFFLKWDVESSFNVRTVKRLKRRTYPRRYLIITSYNTSIKAKVAT